MKNEPKKNKYEQLHKGIMATNKDKKDRKESDFFSVSISLPSSLQSKEPKKNFLSARSAPPSQTGSPKNSIPLEKEPPLNKKRLSLQFFENSSDEIRENVTKLADLKLVVNNADNELRVAQAHHLAASFCENLLKKQTELLQLLLKETKNITNKQKPLEEDKIILEMSSAYEKYTEKEGKAHFDLLYLSFLDVLKKGSESTLSIYNKAREDEKKPMGTVSIMYPELVKNYIKQHEIQSFEDKNLPRMLKKNNLELKKMMDACEKYMSELEKTNMALTKKSESYLSFIKKLDLQSYDNLNMSALHYLAQKNHLAIIKDIEKIRKDFTPNIKTVIGSPLSLAAFQNNLELTKYLVEECFAKLEIPDKEGCAALHLSINSPDVLEYLLSITGTNHELQNKDHLTFLGRAILFDQFEPLKIAAKKNIFLSEKEMELLHKKLNDKQYENFIKQLSSIKEYQEIAEKSKENSRPMFKK